MKNENQAEVQRQQAEQLAKQIEIANHLYQIKCGDNYRCMWCGRESLAVLWVDMYTCPLCGRLYDPIQVVDYEE